MGFLAQASKNNAQVQLDSNNKYPAEHGAQRPSNLRHDTVCLVFSAPPPLYAAGQRNKRRKKTIQGVLLWPDMRLICATPELTTVTSVV